MLKSLMKFFRGLIKMGFLVMGWLALLGLFNMVLPLYFWPQTEAILALVVFILSFLSMIIITHNAGFTRLLGLGHFLWIPLVVFFLFRIDFTQLREPFYLWMAGIVILNSISLVIDISDVIKYVRGDKAPLVEGLSD